MATPITYKALQSTWNIFKSLDNGYNIVSSGIYEFVESVEKGEDDYSATVTFSKPFYPLQSLFSETPAPRAGRYRALQQRLRGCAPPRVLGWPLHPGG